MWCALSNVLWYCIFKPKFGYILKFPCRRHVYVNTTFCKNQTFFRTNFVITFPQTLQLNIFKQKFVEIYNKFYSKQSFRVKLLFESQHYVSNTTVVVLPCNKSNLHSFQQHFDVTTQQLRICE